MSFSHPITSLDIASLAKKPSTAPLTQGKNAKALLKLYQAVEQAQGEPIPSDIYLPPLPEKLTEYLLKLGKSKKDDPLFMQDHSSEIIQAFALSIKKLSGIEAYGALKDTLLELEKNGFSGKFISLLPAPKTQKIDPAAFADAHRSNPDHPLPSSSSKTMKVK